MHFTSRNPNFRVIRIIFLDPIEFGVYCSRHGRSCTYTHIENKPGSEEQVEQGQGCQRGKHGEQDTYKYNADDCFNNPGTESPQVLSFINT